MKKFRPQTNPVAILSRENHLDQDFTTTGLNEKWAADITYIHTVRDGWCYLASVLDLHSKKVVGYSFSRSMTAELVLQALHNAVSTQLPAPGLLIHTYLGAQYTSEVFAKHVQAFGFTQSFSRKGCPYDNACIESFHAILKKEEVHHAKYLDYTSAKLAMFQYIEGWYNPRRIHSQLGYRTPQEVEDRIRHTAS